MVNSTKTRIAFITVVMLALTVNGLSQDIYPWPDHVFPFCTDENPYGITYESGTRGYAAFPNRGSMGCLGSTPGPVWYYMQIDHPGDLLIYLEQLSIIGHFGLDVDFACWGPFQAESKRDFLEKLRNSYNLEVSGHPNHRPEGGNHSRDLGGYPFNNLVDCSFHPASTEWCFIPNAKSGEWYLLLITNYSQEPGKIHFERVDSMSTATTKCDITIPITINPVPKGLKKIDDRTTAICLYEEKALVTVELETDPDFTLSSSSLRKTRVEVYADGKTYQAHLVDNRFECEIDIVNDTTVYYATVRCPDPNFELQTERHSIVRTEDCNPDQIPSRRSDTIRFGAIDIKRLKRGDEPIIVDVNDPDNPSIDDDINIDDYDPVVSNNNVFIKLVRVQKKDNNIELMPELRGDWCECFIPDSLTFDVILIPKDNRQGSPLEIPIKIGVERHSAWIIHCFRAIAILGILVLLFIYLWALLKKNRFKKEAVMNPIYFDRNGDEVDNHSGTPLRKEGFGAWLKRWLWPRDERNDISFDSPSMSPVTFVAADSDSIVNIVKADIDAQTMSVDGYDPKNDRSESKYVKLGSNGKINITKPDGTPDGHVVYSAGDERDGGGYRLLVSLLLIADAAAIVALVIILIKSLL